MNVTEQGTAYGPDSPDSPPPTASVGGGAAEALTELFREHHLELVRLAMVMLQDQATAEDVVQDAFERLHRGWPTLRKPGNSLAYVRSPPYYVVLVATQDRQHPVKQSLPGKFPNRHRPEVFPVTETAVVHDSVTGRVLDRVRIPGGSGPPFVDGITASAGSRSFVITNNKGIFLLRLPAGGRTANLSRLPISSTGYVVGVAAAISPDGNEAAIAVEQERCPRSGCAFGIEVMSLRTGTHRTWWSRAADETNLSWSADGKQILFLPGSAKLSRYRLLDVTARSGNLMTASRPVNFTTPMAEGNALLTPDSRAVVTVRGRSDPGRHTVTASVVELSASTGRLLRVLGSASTHYTGSDPWPTEGNCGVLALGPAGVHPLVGCFGQLSQAWHGRLMALPGAPGGSLVSWNAAW